MASKCTVAKLCECNSDEMYCPPFLLLSLSLTHSCLEGLDGVIHVASFLMLLRLNLAGLNAAGTGETLLAGILRQQRGAPEAFNS